MGRIIGLPFFFSDEAYDQQQDDASNLRRARHARTQLETTSEESEDPVLLTQATAAKRMQEKFEKRIIRRTAQSLNLHNKPLISLPPLTVVHAILQLTDRELDIIEALSSPDLEEYVDILCFISGSSLTAW